ncbi:response regulator [Gracilinema caldarium]|uniref:response regulator n=1 Tax=Gracilinema caldarium TaxID=215591 RepID=UPI0026EA1D36|nr:response regulator [Gracilinema caldarium]
MGTILIIDDDSTIQDVAEAILKRQGYTILKALDTQQAERFLASTSIDLILLDIVLPGQGGLEYLMDIRDRYPSISVIVMSGKVRTDLLPIKKLAQQFGAVCILSKPFTAPELIDVVSSAFKNSCA